VGTLEAGLRSKACDDDDCLYDFAALATHNCLVQERARKVVSRIAARCVGGMDLAPLVLTLLVFYLLCITCGGGSAGGRDTSTTRW